MHHKELLAIGMVVLSATSILAKDDFHSCDIPKCRHDMRTRRQKSMMKHKGKPLPTILRAVMLDVPKGSQSKECYFNTSDLIADFKPDDLFVTGVFIFRCVRSLNLHFSVSNTSKLNNSFSYLQLEKCQVNLEELNKLSDVINQSVLTSYNAQILTDYTYCNGDTQFKNSCSAFDTLTGFWFHNVSSVNISAIFECNSTFPDVREVTLSSLRLTEFPDSIRNKFPYLQSLDISGSQLSIPPPFPWDNSMRQFSRNLSRMESLDYEYAEVLRVEVELNYHRRLLNLKSNKIQYLKNYKFNGLLHILQLSENGLKEIGNDTFRNISGLQHLDLSRNNLQNLPVDCFSTLIDLKYLDIHGNDISYLEIGIFDNNSKLQYLNLANNSISSIPKKLFTYLVNLVELRLSFNDIKSFEMSSFQTKSLSLEFLYLDSNPISTFPDVVLYIRSLKSADLSRTDISFDSFDNWLSVINSTLLQESIKEKQKNKLVTIDLTRSNVKQLSLRSSAFKNDSKVPYIKKLFLTLIKHYEIILDDNPLKCDCRINEIVNVLHNEKLQGSLTGNEYFFQTWKCEYPEEFKGRRMMSIENNETYCEEDLKYCPDVCTCFVRAVSNRVIVDCRNKGLRQLPNNLPNGSLDIWFQDNNITILSNRPYFPGVVSLNLSENQISQINGDAISSLEKLEELSLESNHLASLPRNVESLEITTIYLKNNPFRCDCNTLWMKKWMLRKHDVVKDIMSIVCNVDDKTQKGEVFTGVPDNTFVCLEDYDAITNVVIPSVTSSVVLAIMMLFSSLLYVYRFGAKVLLYIYCGFHPFDRDIKHLEEEIDLLIIYPSDLTEWVTKNILNVLEGKENGRHYFICDVSRDFIAGFSFQENITSAVQHSKKMLLVLSSEFMDDDLFKLAWNETQEKIKERANYLIIVTYQVYAKQIKDKDLKRFVKSGKYIDAKQNLFREKLLYSMPETKLCTEKQRRLPDLKEYIYLMYEEDETFMEPFQRDAFIAYSENEIDFTMNELKPQLENKGYSLCLPDRDFIPGASKEENILNGVNNCLHTLFVLSGDNLQDEWNSFTFKTASEKSLRQKCNHLIVLLTDDTNMDTMDEEVTKYVKTHVTIDLGDPLHMEKLYRALPDSQDQDEDNALNDKPNIDILNNIGNGDVLPQIIADNFCDKCMNGVKCAAHKYMVIVDEIDLKDVK